MGASAVVRGRTRTRGPRISEAPLQRARAGAQEVPPPPGLPGDGKEVLDCPPPPPPPPPPLGVESRVSPMWWSRGNSFDLLHSDPPDLGAKLNNRTAGPDVLGRLGLGMRARRLYPRVENVGGLPPRANGRSLKRTKRGSQRGQHSFEMYG